MNTEKIALELINNPLINKAELARRMFPNNKTPEQALNRKLAGYGYARITQKDISKIVKIIESEVLPLVNKINNKKDVS